MTRDSLVWIILLLLGGLFLAGRAMLTSQGMGKAYVSAGEVNAG